MSHFAGYNRSYNCVELGANILRIIGILGNVKPIKKLTKTEKISKKDENFAFAVIRVRDNDYIIAFTGKYLARISNCTRLYSTCRY